MRASPPRGSEWQTGHSRPDSLACSWEAGSRSLLSTERCVRERDRSCEVPTSDNPGFCKGASQVRIRPRGERNATGCCFSTDIKRSSPATASCGSSRRSRCDTGETSLRKPRTRIRSRRPKSRRSRGADGIDARSEACPVHGLEPYAAYGPARPRSQFLLAEPRVSGHHRGLGASRRSR